MYSHYSYLTRPSSPTKHNRCNPSSKLSNHFLSLLGTGHWIPCLVVLKIHIYNNTLHRVGKVKKTDNTKGLQEHGAVGVLRCHWRQCDLVQPCKPFDDTYKAEHIHTLRSSNYTCRYIPPRNVTSVHS